MASTYKKIGDYISVIDNRNVDGHVSNLMGISIDKRYIPSVANTIGTDLSKYKIIAKNQFACSLMQVSRDQRIPIALYTAEEPAIMSPAYVLFEVVRPTELMPEYLDLWFKRAEFDREASFYAVGGVRGSLDWEDFCRMELPILPIDEQRKIVHDYQVITDRIALLRKINANLDSHLHVYSRRWLLSHAIYTGQLSEYCTMQYGYTEAANFDVVGPKFLRITDITDGVLDWDEVPYCKISNADLSKYKLNPGDVVIARTGATSGAAKLVWNGCPEAVFASFLVRVLANDSDYQLMLAVSITDVGFYEFVQANAESSGSAQPQANPPLLGQYVISVPKKDDMQEYNATVRTYLDYISDYSFEISKLKQIRDLLLIRLSSMSKGA